MDAMGRGILPRKFPRHADIGQDGLHRPKLPGEGENRPQLSLEPSNLRQAGAFTSSIAEPRMP